MILLQKPERISKMYKVNNGKHEVKREEYELAIGNGQ